MAITVFDRRNKVRRFFLDLAEGQTYLRYGTFGILDDKVPLIKRKNGDKNAVCVSSGAALFELNSTQVLPIDLEITIQNCSDD